MYISDRDDEREVIEFFECPYCGNVDHTFYTAKTLGENYICSTLCGNCGKEVRAVDAIERCIDCKDRLECLFDRCITCIIAMSAKRLTASGIRKAQAKIRRTLGGSINNGRKNRRR